MNLDWGHGHLPPPDLPADPALPQRETLTDLDAVGRLLGTSPPDRVDNVWYLPGRRLQVVYSWADPRIPPALVRHEAGAASASWRLPDDPVLAALREVVGPWSESWQPLSWLPGVRVTLRDRRVDEVVKVADVASTERSVAVTTALWSAPGREFRMPQPRPGRRALAERREAWVPGRPLAPVDAASPERLSEVARAAAALHRTPLVGLAEARPDRLVRLISHKVTARLGPVLPGAAAAADRLAAALSARAPEGTGEAATLHGDLHPANLRVADVGLVLLDLDAPVRGDPADDLALFAGRLLLSAMVRDDDPGPALAAAAELPVRYADAPGGRRIRPATYAWHLAAHLAGRHTRTCVRHWAPGVAHLVPALLNAAESTLAAGRPAL